jgi:hypothetical protein
MRNVWSLLVLVIAGIILSALAWPLLIVAGIGVGIAALSRGAVAAIVPAAFVAGALGVIGLVFRLLLAVAGVTLAVVFGILSACLPLLLIALGAWWLLRGSRDRRRDARAV